ncbi:MAG: SDR family NAD(P)-dependent oxidoreductase [Propionibacteriaceae bacterium]|nr:SDR family NAD(P)-dependent oxidoreductase [Propionibacteriaceae bacterium]
MRRPRQSLVPCPVSGHRHRLADLTGRTAVVTGGAAGIGYFTAEGLAALGAHVIILGRDAARAHAAQRAIAAHIPGASVTFQALDLADLASVAAAAKALSGVSSLDVVVANASAIGFPEFTKPKEDRGIRPRVTADGHELFWGTNFLGHYALLASLLPQVLDAAGCVLVGSLGARTASRPASTVPTPDLQASDLAKYAQSKRALGGLHHELARRLARHGRGARVVMAHPGTAVDFLAPHREGVAQNDPDVPMIQRVLARPFVHGKDAGAQSLLTAAACPDADNGSFWGPRWLVRGRPARMKQPAPDVSGSRRLVEAAAKLAGLELPR